MSGISKVSTNTSSDRHRSGARWLSIIVLGTGLLLPGGARQSPAATAPQPAVTEQDAVLSGGCFWGVDAVFKHVKGVVSVTSGYSGGSEKTAQYEMVSTGTTGHAETVKIVYDPSRITYQQLLKVFFFVAHDPTELNRQGPDTGTQYRSVIFFTDAEQQRLADRFIANLNRSSAFS